MRFWDSSALVPVLAVEASTRAVQRELDRDPDVVVWWGTATECASALARREREGRSSEGSIVLSYQRLTEMTMTWREIQPTERVRQTATRLVRVHPLSAADALQLSAAVAAAEDQPASLPFVTLDDRLAAAAIREGFRVIKPGGSA